MNPRFPRVWQVRDGIPTSVLYGEFDLDGESFALAGAQRASFETRASATVLTIEVPDGTGLSYARQAAPAL